jgi:MFS family permease
MSRTHSEGLEPGVWKIIAVAILAPFMSNMNSTVVNVSLSFIKQELRSSIASAQWVVSGYLLALALMLPLNGWLVGRLGAKRLYLICFSSFTLASFLCGAATTMPELIGARLIQGMAGGLLAPLTQLMVARVAGRQFARVLGYAVVPILLAPLAGPILAGRDFGRGAGCLDTPLRQAGDPKAPLRSHRFSHDLTRPGVFSLRI